MNNNKRRWLAAVMAVVLSSSTALSAFAESTPVGMQSGVGTYESMSDNLPASDEEEVTSAKTDDSVPEVQIEDSLPKKTDYAEGEIDTNEKLFQFEDIKDSDGKVQEGVCSVSLTSVAATKNVIRFPAQDSTGRTVTRIGNCTSLPNRQNINGVIIPKTVTEIAAHAFSGSTNKDTLAPSNTSVPFKSLSTVNFYGEGEIQLTSIGNYAFYACTNLEELSDMISAPYLGTIGTQAFKGCISITGLKLGDSIVSVGDGAFKDCTKIDNLSISSGAIGKSAFEGCIVLKEADLSNCQLGSNAFKGCKIMKTVKFSDDVKLTYLDNSQKEQSSVGVFQDCVMLNDLGITTGENKIQLPDTITSIPNDTFSGCTGITKVVFPNNLKTIGSNAFKGCSGLKTLPDLNYTVGVSAFENCTALTKVNVTGGELGNNVFRGCSELKNAILNNCSLGNSVFENCKTLKTVKFGETVSLNGTGAFKGCEMLDTLGSTPDAEKICLPNSITVIPDSTFSGCKAISDIEFPSNLSVIGKEAFSGCDGLEYVAIDRGELRNKAFANCVNLKTVRFESDASFVDDSTQGGMFQGCISLVNFGPSTGGYDPVNVNLSNISVIPNLTFSGCSAITEITFPDSNVSIGELAFNDCKEITKVNLPKAYLYKGAFKNCIKLKTVQIKSTSKLLGDEIFSGCVALDTFGEDTANNPGKVIVFANTGEWICKDDPYASGKVFYDAIPNKTFLGCTSIKNVTLSDTLEAIGGNAFQNCTGITKITMPESLELITGSAFAGCTGLVEFTVPKNVSCISVSAFSGCKSLKKFTYNTRLLTEISKNCFDGCILLSDIKLPDSIVDIRDNAFKSCVSLTDFDFGVGDLATIGANAFSGCTGFETIFIPRNISFIGSNAFSGCTGLTSMVVDTNATIGDSAFTKCTALTDAIIYASSIGKSVFSGCSELTEVYLADYVYAIGDSAFMNCTKLSDIELPQDLISLNANTFSGCKSLESILIQNKVTDIGKDVFKSCPTSLKITYKGEKTGWEKIINYSSLDSFEKIYNPQIKRKPATVVNLKATPNEVTNSVDLTWFKNPSANGYIVYQFKNNNWVKLATIDSNETISYSVSGYSKTADYVFNVVAFDENANSKDAYAALLQPVKNFKAISVGTSATLTWTKNAVAQGYNVWKSDDNITWKRVGSTNTNSYNIDKLTSGKKCYFKVTAYYGRNESAPVFTNVIVGSTPAKVTGFSGIASTTSVKLVWNKKTDATGYKVDIWQNNAWVQIKSTSNNADLSVVKTGLKAGTSYKFRIRAYKDSYIGEELVITVKTKTAAEAKISNLSGTSTENSIKLAWNKFEEADCYKIYKYVDGKWVQVYKTSNNSMLNYSLTGLTQNTSYQLRVEASKCDFAIASSDITVKTAYSKIANLKATTTTNSAKLTWSKPTSTSYYKVFVYQNNKWNQLANITTNSYTVTNLTPNTSYKYRISAYNSSNKLIGYSDVTAKTAIGKVDNLKGTTTSNSAKLTWSKPASTSYYKVFVYQNNKWNQLVKTSTNSYTATSLNPSTSYKYRVSAYNSSNKLLAYSDVTVKTTAGKIANLKGTTTSNSAKLTWSKPTSASYYKIFIYKNGGWTQLTKTSNNSYTATKLAKNSSYKFRVSAYNKNNTLIAYSDITVKTTS